MNSRVIALLVGGVAAAVVTAAMGQQATAPPPSLEAQGYVKELTGVAKFVLQGKRIALVRNNGEFYLKEGKLDGHWSSPEGAGHPLVRGAKDFFLDGRRIGVLLENGDLYVRDGGLGAPTAQNSNACGRLRAICEAGSGPLLAQAAIGCDGLAAYCPAERERACARLGTICTTGSGPLLGQAAAACTAQARSCQ